MIFYTEGGQSQASSADNGTKIEIILANKQKYSISAMCRALGIPRGLVYYKRKARKYNSDLENNIISIFKESTPKVSRAKIIMVQEK